MASKDRQIAAIEDSRPPERDSLVYQTIHNLEIPNLAVTVRKLNPFEYFMIKIF